MGVYIKMEMPQSCDDCRLNNGISCYAVPEYTEDGVVGRTDDRPEWCPLVPVPGHHGRLIDADALEYHADNVRDPMGRTEKTVMWKKIESAQTILPAEEGE